MARKSQEPQVGAEELFRFWRSVMTGAIRTENPLIETDVTLELRMRASENLAKYLVTKPRGDEEEAHETVTPDVLRLARLLEERATPDEVTRLWNGGHHHGG